MIDNAIPHYETDDLAAQLQAFRATHPYTQRTLVGHAWEYIACGQGTEVMLLLPGGLGLGETAFRYVTAFEPNYRVISPTYPHTITSIAQLVEGLRALLDPEGIGRVHVVGGSYSGMIAQALTRHVPQMIASLVLSNTGVSDRGRGRLYAWYLRVLKRVPWALTRRIFAASIRWSLREMPTDRAFWRTYFDQALAALTPDECWSRAHVWIDWDRNYTLRPTDPLHWHGPTLMIEAEHDELFRAAERRKLKALYPQAQLHTLAGAKHSVSLARTGDYIVYIQQFLAKEIMSNGWEERWKRMQGVSSDQDKQHA